MSSLTLSRFPCVDIDYTVYRTQKTFGPSNTYSTNPCSNTQIMHTCFKHQMSSYRFDEMWTPRSGDRCCRKII